MKTFKTELLIFIHNFFTVLFILSGWSLLLHAPDLAGHIVGFITLSYGCYLLISAIKKGVDEFIKINYPNLLKNIEKELEKKGKN
jgi:hypothetical protein